MVPYLDDASGGCRNGDTDNEVKSRHRNGIQRHLHMQCDTLALPIIAGRIAPPFTGLHAHECCGIHSLTLYTMAYV